MSDQGDTGGKKERRPMGQPARMDTDVRIGEGPTLTTNLADRSTKGKPVVDRVKTDGVSVDAGTGRVHEDNNPRREGEEDHDADLGLSDEEREASGEADDGGEEAPLPDYDPEDAEVAQQYEARFLKDGAFDRDALTQDYIANVKDGDWTKGDISPGTRKFLNAKGLSDQIINDAIEGEKAKAVLRDQAVYSRSGGADTYNSAIQWAREGGYSKEAAERFNAAVFGGNQEARDDAVDLLMQRFQKANPKGRKPSPQRTTASAGAAGTPAGGGVQPYASQADWRADLRKARTENNQALLEQTRKRLKASPWYTGSRK